MICVRWNATAALYKSWREPAPPIVALSLFGDRGAPLPKYGSDELQLPSSQSPPLLCARCSLLATSFWRHRLFSRWLSLHSPAMLINSRTLIRITRILYSWTLFVQCHIRHLAGRDISFHMKYFQLRIVPIHWILLTKENLELEIQLCRLFCCNKSFF